jgi:hypothetical protein
MGVPWMSKSSPITLPSAQVATTTSQGAKCTSCRLVFSEAVALPATSEVAGTTPPTAADQRGLR